MVLLAACGKKGPPTPPLHLGPAPPGLLRARQIGPEVVLTAVLPGIRTDGTPLGSDTEVQVMRMRASGTLRPGSVSDRYLVQQFERGATIIARLSGAALGLAQAGGRLQYRDRPGEEAAAPAPPSSPGPAPSTTTGSGASPGPLRYLYGLRVSEGRGQRSPLRAPVMIEIVPPPAPPQGLAAEEAEGEIRLTWTVAGPAAGAEPATGATPAGGPPRFNLYRRIAASEVMPDAPLHPTPLEEPAFVDRTFTYDVNYVYVVRAVAGLSESIDSSPVEIRPHDRFAPATPEGLAVAVEGGVVKVYWFPNAEADLAGYRIYRRAGKEAPVQVAEVPVVETSWVDTGAVAGVRYYYSVSAIDGAEPVNESPRSEEKSEKLSGEGAP